MSHAKHNEDCCRDIDKLNKYNDWVVTTAFYSAMHYLYEKLFPCKINNLNIKSFSHFYYIKYSDINISKHEATIDLAFDCLGEYAGSKYNELFDNCMNARYTNYKIRPEIKNKCLKNLTILKDSPILQHPKI